MDAARKVLYLFLSQKAFLQLHILGPFLNFFYNSNGIALQCNNAQKEDKVLVSA